MSWRDSTDIEITVTQYDIDMAIRYNEGRTDWFTDPISHAVKRKLGRNTSSDWSDVVGNFYSHKSLGKVAFCDVYNGTEVTEYDILPAERAGKLLQDFWYGMKVEPGRFRLRLSKVRRKKG